MRPNLAENNNNAPTGIKLHNKTNMNLVLWLLLLHKKIEVL